MGYPSFVAPYDRERWDEMTESERTELVDYAAYLNEKGYEDLDCIADVQTCRIMGV